MNFRRFHSLLTSIILHPIVLALPLALFIILLTPDVFDKYTITPIAEKVIGDGNNIEYYDLNHDGISEWYFAGSNEQGGSSVAVRNQLGVVFHWDIEGSFVPKRMKCMVGDFDKNGVDEIYAFTIKRDSLLISCINYLDKGKFIFKNKLVTRIKGKNPVNDFSLFAGKITDLNGDGFKEVVFGISTGYGLSPRKMFAIDVKNNQVLSSPELGGHIGPFEFADIDEDGKDEIAITNYGPGNIIDPILPMQDTCAYVIVLDNNLNFMFKPIPLIGRYSGIQNRLIRTKDGYIIASVWGPNSQIPGVPSIKLYDINGNFIRIKNLPTEFRGMAIHVYGIPFGNEGDKILVAAAFENIQFYSTDLRLLETSDIKPDDGPVFLYDVDQDGIKEVILRSGKPERWIIVRNNLKYPVVFETHATISPPVLYTILKGEKKPQFCFQLDNRQYIMEYGFNRMYYWLYPVYLGIYLGVFIFIFLIQRILKFQLQKKYETEKRIAELQYVSLQNQISPHFTFNVLNTIGSAINQEKKDDAYQLLVKFSKLLRTLLTNPDKVTRTIKEELEFVTNFLEIQKHRFNNLFRYRIDVDPEISMDQHLPKSCIQTYVENALKHGISPLKQNGVITITITKQKNNVVIKVSDNGVGRSNSTGTSSTSTGRGLKIMHEYFELFNKVNMESMTEEFIDLKDSEGKAAGTEVIIRIPDDFKFFFSAVSANN